MSPEDRLSFHLSAISPAWIVFVAGAALLTFILVPKTRRLGFSVGASVVWLTVGQMRVWELTWSLAKATSVIPFLLVAIAALRHAGFRRSKAPFWAYAYVFLAVWLLVLAVFGRAALGGSFIEWQWIVVTVAAFLVARIVGPSYPLRQAIKAVAVGAGISLGIVAQPLLIDPTSVLVQSGRLWPFGANPNEIGPLFTVAVPLFVYLAVSEQTRSNRAKWAALSVAALVVAPMLGSRLTMLTVLVGCLPFLLFGGLRLQLAGICAIGAFLIFSLGPLQDFRGLEFNTSRLLASEETRFTVARIYLSYYLFEQPWGPFLFGWLSAVLPAPTRLDPHNAFLVYFGRGGFVFLGWLLIVIGATLLKAWRVVSDAIHADRLLLSVLAAQLVAIHIRGLGGIVAYSPTVPIGFYQMLLALFFVFAAADLRHASPAEMLRPPRSRGPTAPSQQLRYHRVHKALGTIDTDHD